MEAGYGSCSRTPFLAPENCSQGVARCNDEGGEEKSTSPPVDVSAELLLRGWIGGLICGGAVPRSTAECPRPYTTRDISKDSASFFDFYDVDNCSNIGKGGFGIVNHAFHKASQTHCSVKIIDKEGAGKSYRDHLVDGGVYGAVYDCLLRMTVMTPSPHVVHYFDLLEGTKNYFVVMEFLEGKELLGQFEEDLPVTETYCQQIMVQILRALRHLHDVVGLIHRDIKLENFRYRRRSKESELVLVDFGLARFVAEDWDGSVSGTLLYLAPEAVRAVAPQATEGYGTPADVWSAGLIFYMTLVGKVPWDDTKIWTLGKAEHEARALLSATLEDATLQDFTRESVDLLHSLLDYDPKTRTSASKALEHPWFAMSGARLEKRLPSVCYGIVREASQTSQLWTSHASEIATARAKAGSKAAKTAITGNPVPVCVPVCLAPPAMGSDVSEDFIY